MDGANVGMVQSGSCLGLALKARQSLRIAGYLVGEKLDSDKAVKPQVLGLVYHAHTTELGDDAVVRDRRANHDEASVTVA